MPGVLPFIFILAIVALGIIERVARNAPKSRYRLVKGNIPVCGGCGHPAMLDETDRCPECGETYAHAGVYTRALETRLGPPFALTAIQSIAGAIVVGFLLMLLALLFTSTVFMRSQNNVIAGFGPLVVGVAPLVVVAVRLVRQARERRRVLAPTSREATEAPTPTQ